VILLLDHDVRLTSHTCFLSFSPVLKSILMNVEVRLDKPCISLPGFSQESVQHLLQFLHRGYVVISKKRQKEFLLLCTSLRINPPVVKEELDDKEMVLDTTSDNQHDGDQICDKTEESQRDGDVGISKESDDNEFLELLKSPKADSDEETPEHISDFLNQLNKSALNTNNNDNSKQDHNCDEEELVGLDLMPEVEDTFKMPESFDIPQDYIKEIFPKKSKFTRDSEPAPPKAGPSSTGPMFDKLLRDEYLDNGNTLEQEVMQITYKKDFTSKRNQGIQGKLNPKRDRKKIMADLFNDSDSEQEEEKDEAQRSPTPSSSLVTQLEEKRNRVRDKLSTEKVSSKKKESFLSKSRKVNASQHSSFNRNEEDDKFIVSDNESSGSDSEDGEDLQLTSESEADDRKKRLEDRKKKKGGDVLAWMNKKAKVKVNVQTTPKSFIQDMAQYKLRLHFQEDSSSSEPEKTSKSSPRRDDLRSDSESSDDSIPRGKRINPIKSSSSSTDSEEERKRRKERKKRKKKKYKKKTRENSEDFPVEEVVWTPSMYQKWDKGAKIGVKRKASNSDSERKGSTSLKFQRSASIDLKKSSEFQKYKNQKKQMKMQRSVSTIETVGTAFGKSGISWPASSLPKIPKLKKTEAKNN